MPVRGYLRSKLWYSFKIGAINAKRIGLAMSQGSIYEIFKVQNAIIIRINNNKSYA